MKTRIGIGVILAVTVIVAAFLYARDSGPEGVEAKVEADGGLTFVGEGDARTEPLDIPSGDYSIVAVCSDDEPFALTLVDGDTSERLLSDTGLVTTRIEQGSTFDVECPGRWGVVVDDPLPLP